MSQPNRTTESTIHAMRFMRAPACRQWGMEHDSRVGVGLGPGCPLWVKSRHFMLQRRSPLYPESGHRYRNAKCPLSANSGHCLLAPSPISRGPDSPTMEQSLVRPTLMRIVHLIQVPKLRPELEQWFIDEWTPWYGPDGDGDAKADLDACDSRDKLPICLVALSASGELIGTASIRDESVGSELGVGPWLSAVLVKRQFRGKGIGTALVEAIETEAARLGFKEIYTSTDVAMKILERRGWEIFGAARSLRGELSVYRQAITGNS